MKKTISKKLKLVRKALGFSQKEFSDFLGVPLRAYQNWERKVTCPDLNNLVRIADKLCISTDWLLGREFIFAMYNVKSKKEIKNFLNKVIEGKK